MILALPCNSGSSLIAIKQLIDNKQQQCNSTHLKLVRLMSSFQLITFYKNSKCIFSEAIKSFFVLISVLNKKPQIHDLYLFVLKVDDGRYKLNIISSFFCMNRVCGFIEHVIVQNLTFIYISFFFLFSFIQSALATKRHKFQRGQSIKLILPSCLMSFGLYSLKYRTSDDTLSQAC